MTYIPMPSPLGTNHERLFISTPRGPAYDSRHGRLGYDAQPPASKACQLADQLVSLLSQDELSELGREVIKARDCKYGSAQDEEAPPSFDPNATKFGPNGTLVRKKALNAGGSAMDSARRRQIAMDAKWASALKGAFAKGPVADYHRAKRMAADTAAVKSLADRYPGFGAIGVQAEEVDRKAGPHSLATDGRRVASLEERYPDLKKIGFAL
jgi:hypothetical protein